MTFFDSDGQISDKGANSISGIGGGIASLYGQFMGQVNQSNGINTTAAPQMVDANGNPSYDQGALLGTANLNPKGAQAGEIATGAMAGLQAGLSTGNPYAAAGGLVVGALTSIFGGGVRKHDMEVKRDIARRNLQMANNLYNNNKTNYLNKTGGMIDYQNKTNNYDRLTNLYLAQSGQQQLM